MRLFKIKFAYNTGSIVLIIYGENQIIYLFLDDLISVPTKAGVEFTNTF